MLNTFEKRINIKPHLKSWLLLLYKQKRHFVTLWFSWNVSVCVLFVRSTRVCVVYVRQKSLLVCCVALLHIATCQPPPLPRVRVAPYSQVTKLSSETYLLPTCTMPPLSAPGGGEGKDQMWLPPNIGGFLSSFAQTQKHNKREQIPKVMCRWLKTAWQLASNGTPTWSDLGGRRLGTANNGDKCRNHNPGVQFNNRQVQLK